jgi:hypothetical protein
MRINSLKAMMKNAARGAAVLLIGAGIAAAQQQVNLSSGRTSVTLPDGSLVPMWGYSCDATQVSGSTATCAALHSGAAGWSPVIITVPSGQDLTISLTNNLPVPTSLTIVGQLGGGLGKPVAGQAVDHSTQGTTWPIANSGSTFSPPVQGPRVQSFGTEVAANGNQKLTWTAPKPGTYLIESGTHPSIQGPMGLYGILVVTAAPSGTTAGTAYPAVTYNAEVPLLFSEIDKTQNTAVDTAVNTAGFSEYTVWTSACGAAYTCYPPTVNYSPTYYLINGVAFDKTNAGASVFSASPATGVTGNVLVRLVNAGLRMHVPALVGSLTGTPAKPGFSLIAEDGNLLPGIQRIQNEVFLAAGKTYDVLINAPATGSTALPIYDRELSLSGGAINRDAGMLAYIGVNGASLPSATGISAAVARADTYTALVAGQTLTVSDPSKGVIANDTNVYGVALLTQAASGSVALNADGTFTYTPASGSTATSDSFSYCANGNPVPVTTTNTTGCSSSIIASVSLSPSNIADSGITCTAGSFTSTTSSLLIVKTPGVLANCKDAANLQIGVDTSTISATGVNIVADANGGFTAVPSSSAPGGSVGSFTFQAVNSQGTHSAAASVTVTFPAASNLQVKVLDGSDKTTVISDYRWIIEEDRTFYVDPACAQAQGQATVPAQCSTTPVVNFGTNFHTSFMPVIATGCTGSESCADSQMVGGVAVTPVARSYPSDVTLDLTKRYYISVLPGDAAQPFIAGYVGAPDCTGASGGVCGHGMGGAPIPSPCPPGTTGTSTCATAFAAVTVLTEPSPYPPATLSVFVFEDDYPLNGEHDAGGGIDVLSPQEPGLGGFQITLQDNAGGTGDATGNPTYDMFNMPLSNSLAGTIDPVTKADACPISTKDTAASTSGDSSQNGIVGMIVTCPKYESDGKTLSPLAGQAIVKNLYPGRYGVIANPGADRIGRGEEWVQTNTLDGQKAHDSFMRIGEPGYFQEFGPAGYHVTIGFANPKIISDRGKTMCSATGADCAHEVKGHVTTARMSRTPDERLYGSGNHDAYAFTQCYVSIGDPDGADFGFSKCDADGNFDFPSGTVPAGNWKITTFDQWNDQVVDGITTAVGMCDTGTTNNCKATVDMGEVAVHQWQANISTRTFFDTDYSGVSTDQKTGLSLVATNIRFRDGSFSNFNSTDLNGYATFNEVFPLFNWYVIETDSTRYKNTGTHVVYDAGGPDDGTSPNGTACSTGTLTKPCGSSSIAANLANTYEPNPLPANLSVPGSVYCDNADCTGFSIANGPTASSTTNHSTGRIDAPWVDSYGWQGYSGQNNFLEFGKKPFTSGENGGIHGDVVYASTRPFDDPQLLLQLSWEPLVPHVRVNLYQVGTAADGITQTMTLVDHTETTSWDDWAQGFRSDGVPNMNCPGQGTDTSPIASDPYFWYTIQNQPQWLDVYNSQHGGSAVTTLPDKSQFKCYDGMHNWNQLQPAPYDGAYKFPSVLGRDPSTGNTTGTNCTICVKNPDSTDPFRYTKEDMLPDGKYVVEVVVPEGYELVKEEDKNILIGDNYIAPVTQQFGGLSYVFILPDQASVASSYNSLNSQNSTTSLGRYSGLASHEADTGSDESFWPCVGEERVVPDFISLFPDSGEVAPFAGATRRLCDRKEVSLDDQTSVLTKFYVFTPTHAASHFSGQITDDFAAEFDPFSPAFGEKFAPAYLPVAIKDWAGNEINRIYADQWGTYNGLNYSTWEVNPPNPTGYGPTMMVTCMNDPGPIADPNHPGQTIIDPLNQSGYSDFCYELPFMPGQTGYFDTPVVPTSAFAGDYNTPDCAYPDATPAVSEVDGDGVGPWVSAAGKQLTITALGNQNVDNYEYSGPSATAAPYNQQRTQRHYGFLTQCTAPITGSTTCNTASSVKIGGVAATIVNWSDTSITVKVPSTVPACSIQQQAQYGGSAANCGQLVITAGNGKQSIDTVTVTVGGKAPTHVSASQTIQNAIDTASPGDLIIIDPTTTTTAHSEMLLMWKPVRLQGVGAASSVIDANPHPAGKLDPWRRQVVCLFGLALNGTPITSTNSYDPSYNAATNTGYSCPSAMQFSVDRLPLEATVGWDATLNGNLAEQLIEPTIMGAYEGAGITVLGKGVKFPAGSNPFASDVFPTGTQLLTASDCGGTYPSNFLCNPSSIDGLTIKNSSQGGGGILAHGWTHVLQIANNRVLNNQGTLSGGITIGQGEHPDAYLVGGAGVNTVPDSCITNPGSAPTNLALPYCFNRDVNVHNNLVIQNSSLGDELFSSTPAGAGGVTFCNGSDYYKFSYNWVCGNMSTGDGAGVAQIGFSYDGDIEHNTILFNQSTNPTITTNGGGLLIMGAPDQDPPCAATNDNDCVSAPGTITPSDGTGPGLVINANLILGNSADAGSGGGLRLQHINGNEVLNFPAGNVATQWPSITGEAAQPSFQLKTPWNAVQVTNNIIANNVAGWDGGGVSLQDALATDLINNTITSNNSTASSGVLFQTLFAPLASTPGVNCVANNGSNSCPQVAGLVSVTNSAVLTANISQLAGGTGSVVCPANHGTSGSCTKYSVPVLYNDIFWKNRSLMIAVGSLSSGLTNQNNTVTVYNSPFGGATATPAASQGSTGACDDPNASYWDIGVRGDTAPGNHSAGTLAPIYSVLTNNTATLSEVGAGSNNLLAPSTLVGSIYCDGARVPVEAVTSLALKYPGWQVPPGTNESNALPAAAFTLTAAATVDEGNNWVNLRWGPLSTYVPNASGVPVFTFNPSPVSTSPAVDYVPTTSTAGAAAPSTDFYGNKRPDPAVSNRLDVGAIEYQGSVPAPTLTSVTPATGVRGTAVSVTLTGTNLSGVWTINLSGTGITVSNITAVNSTTVTATFTIAAGAATGARNISVTTPGGTSNVLTGAFTVVAPTLTSISPATGVQGTAVAVTLTGTNLTGATAITLSGTGITVSNLTAVNSTTVTATFTIAASAGLGARNISVTTPGGTTNVLTGAFTVTAPRVPPTLTSITPATGERGFAVTVTLTGTNLTGATAVNLSGSGIAVSNITVVNSTTLTATFTITAGAATGARNISVTTPGGTSNVLTGAFTVVAPTLTSISPATGVQGTAVAVTLTGTNLTGATAINLSGSGIAVSNITVVNSTTVTATFTIAANAGLGARNISVTSPGGTTNVLTGAFTVTAPRVPPTLTSITPATGVRGSAVTVTLTGTNLTGATAINLSSTGITVSNITVVNSTTLTATFTIAAGAGTGARNVSVTTPGGTSNVLTGAFTVVAPTLTSITPATGVKGFAVTVTLNGTNLTGATAITLSGSGITVSNLTVVNSTTVTATFTIAASAATGARNISVTTPGGTTNVLTGAFTVVSPTLTSITPATGARGTAVTVTLTGTNLTGATAITLSSSGITVSNITVVNSTTVTATFTIASNAGLGARSISVTTPGGTTNVLTGAFTVQ